MYRIWFFCCLLQFGQSFECYQCTSDINQECWSVEYKDRFQKVSCTQNACLTVKLPREGGSERWARDCYQEDLCNEYSVCKKCDQPLCNSSSRVGISVVFLLTAVSLVNWMH